MAVVKKNMIPNSQMILLRNLKLFINFYMLSPRFPALLFISSISQDPPFFLSFSRTCRKACNELFVGKQIDNQDRNDGDGRSRQHDVPLCRGINRIF